jgi:FkbM family methyltransferase
MPVIQKFERLDKLKQTLADSSSVYRSLVYKYRSYRDGWSFPATMAHTTGYKMVTHNYEPEVTAQIQSILRPGDHFLDIGANIGYYSMLAAELSEGGSGSVLDPGSGTSSGMYSGTSLGTSSGMSSGMYSGTHSGSTPDSGNRTGTGVGIGREIGTGIDTGGRQIAVEMEPENYQCLTHNLSNYSAAKPLHCAVSDKCGTITFHRSLHSSCHSLHDTNNLIDRSAAEKEQVRCVTVDHIWQEHFGGEPIKLMKMDVEGAELQALQGGEEAFSSGAIEHIIVEYCPRAMQNAGQDTHQLYQLLSEWFQFGVMENVPGFGNQDAPLDAPLRAPLDAPLQISDFDQLTDLLLSAPGTANCNFYGTSLIKPTKN